MFYVNSKTNALERGNQVGKLLDILKTGRVQELMTKPSH